MCALSSLHAVGSMICGNCVSALSILLLLFVIIIEGGNRWRHSIFCMYCTYMSLLPINARAIYDYNKLIFFALHGLLSYKLDCTVLQLCSMLLSFGTRNSPGGRLQASLLPHRQVRHTPFHKTAVTSVRVSILYHTVLSQDSNLYIDHGQPRHGFLE